MRRRKKELLLLLCRLKPISSGTIQNLTALISLAGDVRGPRDDADILAERKAWECPRENEDIVVSNFVFCA